LCRWHSAFPLFVDGCLSLKLDKNVQSQTTDEGKALCQ
jgi:hypothetical protein